LQAKPVEVNKEENGRKLQLVKHIALGMPDKTPGKEEMVKLTLKLPDGKQADLVIYEKKYDSATCKEIVSDFVMHNYIIPAEAASIYRYVRSIISRLVMERETTAISNEMAALRYPKVIEKCANPTDVRSIIGGADKALAELGATLASRLGSHGPGAEVIQSICKRNIEKSRHHNRMCFATHYGNEDPPDEA
jgi:hypothetical protein